MKRNRSVREGGGNDYEVYDEFRIRPVEEPSFRVVRSVAATTGRECDELRPLYDVIDPDALDALVGGSEAAPRIEFRYEGCHVRVDAERVLVRAIGSVTKSTGAPEIE